MTDIGNGLFTDRISSTDPRPGGLYRVRMGPGSVASGESLEVVAPERVVFTWGWEGSGDVLPGSTTVDITLRPDGDDTILHLRHSGLPSVADAALHREGWEMYLARLNEVAGIGR